MNKLVCFALLTLVATVALAATTKLDSLFTDPKTKTRQPASTWPAELDKEFEVTAPEGRAPASAGQKPVASKGQRRSRLPASIQDGFELRVRYNNLVSMFWVVKREDKYDLMYANSAGSKSSVGLSSDAFKRFHDAAREVKAIEGDLSKCQDASMQLHVIEVGKSEKSVTSCINAKTKPAEALRAFSNTLSSMIQ
jgi:hypothetical protein